MSFAKIKYKTFEDTRADICQLIQELYEKNRFLLEGNLLTKNGKVQFVRIDENMPDRVAVESLRNLMDYLSHYYEKKVIVKKQQPPVGIVTSV